MQRMQRYGCRRIWSRLIDLLPSRPHPKSVCAALSHAPQTPLQGLGSRRLQSLPLVAESQAPAWRLRYLVHAQPSTSISSLRGGHTLLARHLLSVSGALTTISMTTACPELESTYTCRRDAPRSSIWLEHNTDVKRWSWKLGRVKQALASGGMHCC